MPNWVTQFTEAFTDTANVELSAHDSTWVRDNTGDMQINASNQCQTVGTTGDIFRLYHLATTLANNQAAEVDLHDSIDFNGVSVRMTSFGSADDFDGYFAFANSGSCSIYRRDHNGGAPAWTLLDTQVISWTAGDTLRIEVVGSSITTYKNGSATGMPTATDANHASGSAGLRGLRNIDPMFDNFVAEDSRTARSQVVMIG